MNSRIYFAFIGEGSSDNGLICHLQQLLLEAGADEAIGTSIEYWLYRGQFERTVAGKLRVAMALEPEADLYVIQRDTDTNNTTYDQRYAEIENAVNLVALEKPWLPVIPIRETESWLLIDEANIRKVAHRPNGRTPLVLPNPRRIHRQNNAKEMLRSVLDQASEKTGRGLKRFQSEFEENRRKLLEILPITGDIESVEAWVNMRNRLRTTVAEMVGEN
jgi:hypothetical protein